MKNFIFTIAAILLFAGCVHAGSRETDLTVTPDPVSVGQQVHFTCNSNGGWKKGQFETAQITIRDAANRIIVNRADMAVSGTSASYDLTLDSGAVTGTWQFQCFLSDGPHSQTRSGSFTVVASEDPVNHAPSVDAGGPYNGTPGQAVSFDGSGSSDPDGDALTYHWTFGDGGSANGPTPSHAYAAAGTYAVTLSVSDGKGGTDSSQTRADIAAIAVNHLPVAVSGGPYSGMENLAIQFDGSFSSDPDGDPMTFAWDFGDGGSANGPTPSHTYAAPGTYTVILTVNDGKGGTDSHQTSAAITASGGDDGLAAHLSIQAYNGPSTCITCHPAEAQEMLDSLHMQWAGPTPELSNTNGGEKGKGVDGINTFCTYAMSSKSACFTCHVRSDGNASHAPDVNDVDCLMCHNDTYQRKFVLDPMNSETVVNVLGETKTYMFGKVDSYGDYLTEPDFSAMPAGTTMVGLAQNVHLPTRQSCLRCHAKAGGGDWTKRGDMGVNSASPTLAQDVHMSPAGANLSCADCHSAGNHKIGGRGIDLRETEAPDPACSNCHSSSPHSSSTLNRHASGQVACQVCHILEFAKGGATEMSRDFREPHWNAGFCNGQGGFVGHEIKSGNEKPDYRWFDGTSYVYNVGDAISPNADGTYTMARANGKIFDGNSKIVPIKDHWSVMPLSDSGKIVAPKIMTMFMTGDYDKAVQDGMKEQNMTGGYTMVHADAEMLITHGVEPKSNAPSCSTCHDNTGNSNRMIPFGDLGYHNVPDAVQNCTRCHERHDGSWQSVHDRHVGSMHLDCTYCHIDPATGTVKPAIHDD